MKRLLLILSLTLLFATWFGAEPAYAESDSTYVVRPGDTLASIARRHGTTVAALEALNELRYPNFVYPGQRLVISEAAGTSSGPSLEQAETPPSPGGDSERWIDVDLTNQKLTAYEGEAPVFEAVVSTGTARTPTVVGTYEIWIRLRYDDMAGPGYYLKDVPYVMYFYRGYGLHGTYWHDNFGTPMSHGCVNLAIPDAEWLFNWADVGTKVVTHY